MTVGPAGPLLAACLLSAACSPFGRVADGAADDADRREAEVVARSLMSAFETADTALVQELFWPQATYDDFPNQHSYQGIGEIVGYVTGLHAWADGVLMNVGEVHVGADAVVVEWLFSAVQARPMGRQLTVGTGNEVVLNGVTVLELDDGRIVRAADYTDTGALMLQLGGRIEMPDGTTIQLGDVVN